MKKVISIVVSLALLFSLVACSSNGGNSSQGENAKPETNKGSEAVQLTVDNISDYISINGEFTDAEYHQTILYYVSTAKIDFQAYSTASGTFNNVKITVRANISETGALSEKFHLADSDNKNSVEFEFTMPANGNYNHTYSIECDRYSGKLSGSCDFTIVSVSGEFMPA